MPELFDKDNNPVEGALTAEEVEAKLTELKEASSKDIADRLEEANKEHTEKVTTLEGQITTLNEDLDKLGDKDHNFKRLREEKAKLEKSLADHKKEVDDKVNEIVTAGKQGDVDKEITALAGSDEELKKKIVHFYGKLSEDTEDRVNNAYLLAVGGNKPATSPGSFSSQSGGKPPSSGISTKDIGDEAKLMAKRNLGLSDEDFKKAEEEGLI